MNPKDDEPPPTHLEYFAPANDTAPSPEEILSRICVVGAELVIAVTFCAGAVLCVALRPMSPVSWLFGLGAGALGLCFTAIGLRETRRLVRRIFRRDGH